MADPLDYSNAFGGQASPIQSFTQGLQGGALLNQIKFAQQQQYVKAQQQESALQQQQQMQADLNELSANPTPDAIGRISLKYPQLSDQFKKSYDILAPEQQKAKLQSASQVYAAINSGAPEVAVDLLKQEAAGQRNAGDEKAAQGTETMVKLVQDHPEFAKTTVGLILSSALGPEKFTETYGKLGAESRAQAEAPAELAKKQADSQTAQVTAKYADSKALQDLQKTGWDIKKIAADIDISKESNRIAAMNAAANRESNGLKRQELQLKIQDTIAARDQKIQDKVDAATSSISSIDNILNTIDSVKNHPGLGKAVGLSSAFPTTPGSDAADFEAKIETLQSQAFLSQIAAFKGMGALSDAEGKKLQAGLANLSIKQSESQLRKSLGEVDRIMSNARSNLAKKNGIPESVAGGGLVISSPKYGDLNESQVREFAKAKGLTRDQAIQVINSVK